MNSKQSTISLFLAIIVASSLAMYFGSIVEPTLTQAQPESRAQIISLSLLESGFVVAPYTAFVDTPITVEATSSLTNPFLGL